MIEYGLASFIVFNNSGLFKYGQVLTYGSEFHSDSLNELANAVFAVGQLLNDPQSCWMTERLEDSGLAPAHIFIELIQFGSSIYSLNSILR